MPDLYAETRLAALRQLRREGYAVTDKGRTALVQAVLDAAKAWADSELESASEDQALGMLYKAVRTLQEATDV